MTQAKPYKHHITLIVTGSIAAYKAPDLVRLCQEEGIGVTAVMTKAAHAFVTPMTLASVTGHEIYDDLFSLKDESQMGHIQLSRQADLVVVAPASADIMAKCALGLADDLASTILLATDKPVLMAPAMNSKMWGHAAVQRNVQQLKQDGIHFIGPVEGQLACGETGIGRFVALESLVAEIKRLLTQSKHKK